MQGMMEMMPKMMEGMMGGARKELYPYLMGLPSLTSEQRAEVQQLAEERIYEGMVLLQEAQERLASAVESGDHDAASEQTQRALCGLTPELSRVAEQRRLE